MFIKFGSEENIIDLYENGTIFMNSREFFRRIEDKELRGDSYEGVNEIRNYGPGSFFIPSINHTVNYQAIHLPIAFSEVWGNIYCLYCLSPQTTPEMLDFKMDNRVKNFGSYCLMIKDPEKFMSLMEDKFRFLNHKFYMDFVEYYDKNFFNGTLSVFDKPNEFKYQKEFRCYIERDGIDPVIFHLGSLKNFSEIFTTEQIISIELTPSPQGP